MPEHMEGVSAENWRLLMEHEYMHRSALEEARLHVEAELERPRERNLSNLSITVVASLVFGIIATSFFALGFKLLGFLSVSLLVPTLVMVPYFARSALRRTDDLTDSP